MVMKIRELSFTYPNNHKGLIDINLDIEKGKKTAILGINGSGKSTLLYHLNGIHLPQTGLVEVLSMPVSKKNLNKIRRHVSFLFDYPDHQLFSTTVYQDIKFGLDNYKLSEKDNRIKNVVKDLKIENLLDSTPYELSLGQKKKVAIAGLIVLEPSIILCDEPFSGLDGYSMIDFKEVLDDLVAKGKTIVFSTHDVNLTYEWADNVIILKDGKVLKSGNVSDVLTDDQVYKEANLLKPMLYELFKDSKNKPRNLTEARKFLNEKCL